MFVETVNTGAAAVGNLHREEERELDHDSQLLIIQRVGQLWRRSMFYPRLPNLTRQLLLRKLLPQPNQVIFIT